MPPAVARHSVAPPLSPGRTRPRRCRDGQPRAVCSWNQTPGYDSRSTARRVRSDGTTVRDCVAGEEVREHRSYGSSLRRCSRTSVWLLADPAAHPVTCCDTSHAGLRATAEVKTQADDRAGTALSRRPTDRPAAPGAPRRHRPRPLGEVLAQQDRRDHRRPRRPCQTCTVHRLGGEFRASRPRLAFPHWEPSEARAPTDVQRPSGPQTALRSFRHLGSCISSVGRQGHEVPAGSAVLISCCRAESPL